MTLADAHLHLFPRGFPGADGRSVLGDDPEIAAYEARRRVHGIAAGLIIGYEADGIDPANNAYIRGLAATRPWMATLAYVPASPDGGARVAGLLAEGHAGIAVYLPDAARAAVVTVWPAAVWRALGERRAVVSLNARPEAAAELGGTIRGAPGCRFLFSHLGLPGRHREVPGTAEAAARLAPLLDLAALANVFVKISGFYAVSDPPHAYPHLAAAPFVNLLLDRFGAERCLWGSDFSPALEFVSFAQAVAIPWLDRLTSAERTGVMGGNLLRLLGMEKEEDR